MSQAGHDHRDNSDSHRERFAHAYEVTKRGDTTAILRLLDSPDLGVREYVATVVLRQNIREAIPELIRRVQSEEVTVRSRMTLALAEFQAPESRETLWKLIGDDSEDVRRFALRGLSRLGDPGVVDAARATYDGGGYFARQEAIDALVRLGSDPSRAMLQDLSATNPSLSQRHAIRKGIREHERLDRHSLREHS